MVTNASNYGSNSKGAFGKSGVADWIVQRKSAVVMAVYFAYLGYFLCVNCPLTYEAWQGLFQSFVFKIVTLIVLIYLLKHAWVGLWTIATDYIAGVTARNLFLFLCKSLLLVYLIWGSYILWMV